MNLAEAIAAIKPVSEEAARHAQEKLDLIAKPLGSLGCFETLIARLAAISGSSEVDISKRRLVIMCADNGVVEEGVTQTDSMVTAIMADVFTQGRSSVCIMAQHAGTDIMAVDIGIAREMHNDALVSRKVMPGTRNFTREPAMSREQAVKAIETGIEMAELAKAQGYRLLVTGEMGIGNTASTAAVASAILGMAPRELTGCGAGLDEAGLERKVAAVQRALELHKPDASDPLDVLAKVGGLDIAGLCGLYIGGAAVRLPVMMDGVISGVAALLAHRLAPACRDYMLASHISAEPAGRAVLTELGLLPVVDAQMRLGEGTGAMVALCAVDMLLEVYRKAITFPEIDIAQYIHFA